MLNITTGTLTKIFGLIKNAISEIKSNNVGFYADFAALNSSYPVPTVGMMAYVVSSGTTYNIYRCTTKGQWVKTGETYTLTTDILSDLDYTPTSNSEKLVTSGGVYDADVATKYAATSIIPFAGCVAGVTPATMSITTIDDGSNVYYDTTNNAFYLKTGTNSYVNNWGNRYLWADGSLAIYPYKSYHNMGTDILYKADGNGKLIQVAPTIKNISQTDYDALTTKDENVYYAITED